MLKIKIIKSFPLSPLGEVDKMFLKKYIYMYIILKKVVAFNPLLAFHLYAFMRERERLLHSSFVFSVNNVSKGVEKIIKKNW